MYCVAVWATKARSRPEGTSSAYFVEAEDSREHVEGEGSQLRNNFRRSPKTAFPLYTWIGQASGIK